MQLRMQKIKDLHEAAHAPTLAIIVSRIPRKFVDPTDRRAQVCALVIGQDIGAKQAPTEALLSDHPTSSATPQTSQRQHTV